MKAEAHQEAIPAWATTWKRTRYLTEGDQLIGRTGDVPSPYWLPESASVVGMILRSDEPLDVLEAGGVVSCSIAGRPSADRERERDGGRGAEEVTQLSFILTGTLAFTGTDRQLLNAGSEYSVHSCLEVCEREARSLTEKW